MTFEDPTEVVEFEPEVYDLLKKRKFKNALKLHAKVMNRRRGSCNIWTAENDISGAVYLAEQGNINLKLPSFIYEPRSMHANATWKAVDAVVKAIKNL